MLMGKLNRLNRRCNNPLDQCHAQFADWIGNAVNNFLDR
jgi:hypothetical protein